MSEYYIKQKTAEDFEVAKFDGGDQPVDTYQVHIGKTATFCRCPAYSSGKTRPCKHLLGVHKWIANGKMSGPIQLTPQKATGKKSSLNKEREAIRNLEEPDEGVDDADRKGHDFPF